MQRVQCAWNLLSFNRRCAFDSIFQFGVGFRRNVPFTVIAPAMCHCKIGLAQGTSGKFWAFGRNCQTWPVFAINFYKVLLSASARLFGWWFSVWRTAHSVTTSFHVCLQCCMVNPVTHRLSLSSKNGSAKATQLLQRLKRKKKEK